MPDSRIDDLRRRVQKDPASIAFAQLAEELRRAGQLDEAADTCRAGLTLHPSYLSARVTLGRTLVELNRLDEAADELGIVLRSAPENLAAMRAMGEVYQRRGQLAEALAQYRTALAIARNDPDLEETVADLSRKLEPKPPAASADHLSQHEFLQHLPTAPIAPRATPSIPLAAPAPEPEPEPLPALQPAEDTVPHEETERDRASRTVVALERWLDAIHDASADRRS